MAKDFKEGTLVGGSVIAGLECLAYRLKKGETVTVNALSDRDRNILKYMFGVVDLKHVILRQTQSDAV